MEIFQPAVQFFGNANHFDGLTGDSLDGKSCTASGIAVHLCQDGPVDAKVFIKSLGRSHCILAGHGVQYQQDFLGMHLSLDIPKLRHELLINGQTAGSIQNDDIPVIGPGRIHSVGRNVYRIHIRRHPVHRYIGLLPQHFQLLDSGRTVHVAGCQKRPVSFFLKHKGQLAGGGGLAGPLETYQHDHRHAGR